MTTQNSGNNKTGTQLNQDKSKKNDQFQQDLGHSKQQQKQEQHK